MILENRVLIKKDEIIECFINCISKYLVNDRMEDQTRVRNLKTKASLILASEKIFQKFTKFTNS